MNVLHVVSSWKGGAVKVAFDMAKVLARRGHRVTVYATNLRVRNVDEKEINGNYDFHVLFPEIARKVKFYVTPQLISRGREIPSFDVIHLHEYRTFQNIVVHHYAKKHGVPYVLHAHGSLLRTVVKRRLKWIYDVLFGYRLLRDASKVIALSPLEAEQYRRMGVSEEKIAIIPNGIDLWEYSDLPPEGKFKERYGIGKEEKVILYLGRINRAKGIDFLINAFAYMTKKLNYSDALLVIAGPDDGYLHYIKKLVKQRNIENKVLFTRALFGMRKAEAYVDASVVASLDSLEEVVFLLVPLEASACGTPVIVTRSNYISKLVEKERFGSCIDYGDVPKLADTLKEMLSDGCLLREMGLRGRDFVFKDFNWDNIIGMIENVYEEAIKERRR